MKSKKVSNYMTKDVISLPTGKTLLDASKEMLEFEISSIVIMENETKPIGLITSYDILAYIIEKKDDILKLDVELSNFVKPLISIRENASMSEASKIFIENQIHHLVVVSDTFELVGILSTLDLAKALDD